MAAGNPVESLQEEATCPVCLEYFTEPVSLECGHNFCRACISQCWEGSDTAASCPQCRETVQQRNLRPNRQLANVVEIAKQMSLQAARGDGVCGEHQEVLKLFCEEDQTSICVVCDRSRAHRAHKVVPIQEAAQEYKVPSCCQTETVRQKIVSEFQQLQQFLDKQERLLLAGLDKLDKKILKIQNENVTKLSEEISRLSELISEMEGKCQKPASEFLQVRLKSIKCHTLISRAAHLRQRVFRCPQSPLLCSCVAPALCLAAPGQLLPGPFCLLCSVEEGRGALMSGCPPLPMPSTPSLQCWGDRAQEQDGAAGRCCSLSEPSGDCLSA
uniref:Zinc finger protein RFP n=1 Tax=Chelydra serpentina TaxID=8475 RepID=A0A8C3S1H9_CHESE